MKTYASTQMSTVEQGVYKFHNLKIDFAIPEAGLECWAEFKKEKGNIVDNFHEFLSAACKETLNKYQINVAINGKTVALNETSLGLIATELVFGAMSNVSKSGLDVFTVYIDEAKDIYKEYVNKNATLIEKNATLSGKNKPAAEETVVAPVVSETDKKLDTLINAVTQLVSQQGQTQAKPSRSKKTTQEVTGSVVMQVPTQAPAQPVKILEVETDINKDLDFFASITGHRQ